MAHWITNTTYQIEYDHNIEYHFLCRSCGRDNGNCIHPLHVNSVISVEERGFNRNREISLQDSAAMNRIARNKMLVDLRTYYCGVIQNADYAFLGEVKCPHCGAVQVFKTEKGEVIRPESTH